MLELIDSYKEFLIKLKEYRPDIMRRENPWLHNDKNNSIFKDAKNRNFPARESIIPFKNNWDTCNKTSIIYLWHIPNMFNNKILVDFGIPYNILSTDSIFIEKLLDYGYTSEFTIDLTNEALNFISKDIDKNIPIKLLSSMTDYKIVSVGKLGVSLKKMKIDIS